MLAYLFLAIAIAVRVMSGTGVFATLGFTPLGASLLFFGSRMSRKHFAVAVVAVALSDFYLNRMVYGIPLQAEQLIVWAWYIAACFLGYLIKDRVKPLYVGGAALGSSVSFFVISNFAVWAGGLLYPRTLAGLADCYAKAVPFFQRGLASDLLFSALFFGAAALIAQARHGVPEPDANRLT